MYVTRDIAQEFKVVLVDHFKYWSEQILITTRNEVFEKWLNDELHPNGAGHVQLAQLLFRKLSIFDAAAFTCKQL